MKIKHFALIAFASLLTALGGTPSFAVDKNRYLWPQEMNTMSQLQGPHLGYYVTIVDDFTQGPGAMEANSFISVAGNMQPICSGFDDPVCIDEIKAGRGNWWSNIAFAPCKTISQLSACIEAVRIKNSDNTYRNLVLKKVIPGNYWPANPEISLPEGSAPSLWVDPKETNQSKGYLVAATSALSANTNDASVRSVSLTSFQSESCDDKWRQKICGRFWTSLYLGRYWRMWCSNGVCTRYPVAIGFTSANSDLILVAWKNARPRSFGREPFKKSRPK
jgi:hypothetical protein